MQIFIYQNGTFDASTEPKDFPQEYIKTFNIEAEELNNIILSAPKYTYPHYNLEKDAWEYLPVAADIGALQEQEKKQELRKKRTSLLQAFDSYKSAVNYGIRIETAAQKTEILDWYQRVLDLDESAFENVPTAIQYYEVKDYGDNN